VFGKINFLSREQTWLPLFVLLASSLLGLADDFLQVFRRGTYVAGGLKFKQRLFIVFLIALVGALWFYFKLDWRTIYVPGYGLCTALDVGGAIKGNKIDVGFYDLHAQSAEVGWKGSHYTDIYLLNNEKSNLGLLN